METSPSLPIEEPPALKLRRDLRFSFQYEGEEPSYLIEDPVNEQYFRIGGLEYELIRQLDGTIQLPEALERFNQLYPDQAPLLTDQEIKTLAYWLMHSQLAYFQPPKTKTWQLFNLPENPQHKTQWWNPLFIKVNLISPDEWLGKLLKKTQWILGWKFFGIVWLPIIISSLYLLAADSERLISGATHLLSIYSALYLIIIWAMTKIIHEVFHGLVCKKYGGHIHEAGLFLVLLAPIGGYVNASSVWRFTDKWQRIHVSLAGMFIDLFLAGIFTWIWAFTEQGALNFFAYNVIITAGLGTLLFNANPLMRFDGYYILSDALNIPNLYVAGQKYIQYLNKRYLQGQFEPLPPWTTTQTWIIKSYGLAALWWRILIMVGILVTANLMMHGAGIIMATIGLFSWLGIPLIRFIKNLRKQPNTGAIVKHLFLVLSGITIAIFLILTQITWSPRWSAPGILEYADNGVVHTQTSGFVKHILTTHGDFVEAGTILLELENKELTTELKQLELQIKIHQQKRQQLLLKETLLSAAQVEQEKLQDAQHKYRKIAQEVEYLTIKSPISGYVIAEDLKMLEGAYLQRGREILSIGDIQRMEVRFSIDQQDIDYFRAHEHKKAYFYSQGRPFQPVEASLTKINPAATKEIMHPSLTALAGGEIMVRSKLVTEKTDPETSTQYEYLEPRFNGLILLNHAQSNHFKAGEIGRVVIESTPQAMWKILYLKLDRYFRILKTRAEQMLNQQNTGVK
jgi:putative peptide zinc metalloprotease protein